MAARYDIAPNYDGTWFVIDTANRNMRIAKFNSREEALKHAKGRK